MDYDGCRRTARQRAAARDAAGITMNGGRNAAAVRQESETADDDGCHGADETRGEKPAFAAESWEDAADSGCDRIRLHPAGRADALEGAEACLGMAGWVRPCSRYMPSGTTACCAGLQCSNPPEGSVRNQTITPIVMSPSNCWIRRKALWLRQLPGPSLRKTLKETAAGIGQANARGRGFEERDADVPSKSRKWRLIPETVRPSAQATVEKLI